MKSSKDNLCTFCGAPAKKCQEHPKNVEQIIYSCKDADCLNRFRALLEGVSPDTRARYS